MRLSEAIGMYEAHLRARGLAPATVKNSRQVLHRALECWGDIQPTSVKHRHVDRLFSDHDWSPATRNLYLGNLRQFFAWCRSHGLVGKDVDPTTGWRNIRVPKEDRLRIPVTDFTRLLDSARHPRDRAVVALGLFTFLRGGEIKTLRVADLDLHGGTLHVTRHKTKEDDVLPVCLELDVEMRRWLDWYAPVDGRSYLVPAKEKPRMVWNDRTGRLAWDGVLEPVRPYDQLTHPYEHVKRVLATAGLPTHGNGAHTLRRSGARALFDTLRAQGYDGSLMRVSSMLGHRDTKVTERYIGLSLERAKRNESLTGKAMFGTEVIGD